MFRLMGAALAAFFLLCSMDRADAARRYDAGGGSVQHFCGDRYCSAAAVTYSVREGRRARPAIKKKHRRGYIKIAHRSRAAIVRQVIRAKAAAVARAAKAKAVQVASLDPNAVLGEPNPVVAAVRSGTDLLAKFRSYMGTNPTGWARVWCGRMMALVAPEAAKLVPNPNLARSWLALPRVARRVGAIVVLKRGGSSTAGHIGVVEGFGKRGPIVISGNTNGRVVGRNEYPESRVLAYVSPG